MPFAELINDNGTLKSNADLEKIFKSKEINPRQPVINLSRSGTTACVVDMALKIVGAEKS